MRKLFFLTVVSCAVLALGCPKKKDGAADAAADAEAPEAEAPAAAVVDAEPAPAAVNAKNSADVARFPGETAITDDDAKLGQVAPVRTSPRSGSVIATLKPGAEVNKIAEYQHSILVSFADPKDASTTLMGWIGKEAFTASVARDAGVKADAGVVDAGVKADAGVAHADAGAKVTCSAGMAAVVLTKDPVCKKKCTRDSDCKVGKCENASGPTGAVVRVCSSE